MSGNIIRVVARVSAALIVALAGLFLWSGPASAAGKVTLTGNAYSFIFGGHTERLPGAKIGIAELPGATATAGVNGAYSLKVPDNTTITPYATMPGYHRIYLQTFHTRGSDLQQVNFQMPPDEIYDALGAIMQTELDPTTHELVKCAIVSTFFKETARHYENFDDFWGDTPHGIEGGTASGSTNSGRLLPPTLYFNSQVIPDPAQKSTSDDGGAIWDEVDSGVYTVKGHKAGTGFAPFQATCKPGRLVNANPPWGLYQLAPGEKPNPAVYPDRVEARLTRAKAGYLQNLFRRQRVLDVSVAIDEPVSMKSTLKQGRIVQRNAFRGTPDAIGVPLNIKRKFRKGRATFLLRIKDRVGNRAIYERVVRIPGLPRT